MNKIRKWPLWSFSLLVVLGLHILVALWALFWRVKPPPLILPPAAPVMLAQLEPLPPPPPPPPPPIPTPKVESEPEPMPKLAEAPKPVLAVPKSKPKPEKKKVAEKKPEKKVEPPKKQQPPPPKPVEETVAKNPAPSDATKFSNSDSTSTSNSQSSARSTGQGGGAGSPGKGSSVGSSEAKASWQGLLLGHLSRYKRYPEAAKRFERPGAKKMNRLRFVIDASGYVLSYELVGYSGNDLLDQATLDMIKRAQPLPPPPPELLTNGTLEIIAPLVYELKRD